MTRAGGQGPVWRARSGLVFPDRVPYADRLAWQERGLCPDADLFSLFRGQVAAHPARDAVVDDGGTVSYAELYTDTLRIAARFAGAGLGARDVIALRLPNGRLAAAAELAVYALGAVALPYPLGGGVRDTLTLLRRSRAAGAVFSEPADVLAAEGLTCLRAVFGADELASGRGGAAHRPAQRCADPWAPARILVSSGSEAEPKMVAYSHQSLAGGRAAYVRALARYPGPPRPDGAPEGPGGADPAEVPADRAGQGAGPGRPVPSHGAEGSGRTAAGGTPPEGPEPVGGLGPTDGDPSGGPEPIDGPVPRNLVLVSLASSFGSLGVPVTLAALGGTLIVRHRFDARNALRAITDDRPTHVFGVPTMLRRIADLPPAPDEDLSGLRALVSSGAALPDSTAAACRERFGRPVIAVYGSSDGVNCHTAAPGAPADGTAGTPDPAVAELRVVRPDGTPAPPGAEGEILAKGPMSPMCYVGAPELDARYRTGTGWVRTGDLGALDGRGRLRVLGRLRNVVIRGGYTISPAEVERELGTHPALADVVCVSVPDEELGERLCACVRPAPGAAPPTLPGLTEHLRRRGLERRKFPEYLMLAESLPLGPTGKVCRRTVTAGAVDALRAGRLDGGRPPGPRGTSDGTVTASAPAAGDG
ncbi:AMP-binding protein [Streptomyces sp. NPDC052077]|uniref:AMP-binding protein n=1 Tax=Streptomyces sp. NPDC052077 TaxID=3154757 RepID=UPI00343070CF